MFGDYLFGFLFWQGWVCYCDDLVLSISLQGYFGQAAVLSSKNSISHTFLLVQPRVAKISRFDPNIPQHGHNLKLLHPQHNSMRLISPNN